MSFLIRNAVSTRRVLYHVIRKNATGSGSTHAEKVEKVRPTTMQRKFLVWSKTYSKIDDIPKEVSYSKIKRATDWSRIRINIGMCVATLLACFVMMYVGRRQRKSGQSVTRDNLEWHNNIKEEDESKK